MALNDVKEITIPEGSVKKIEDSNGNIIWGSASAFPYRLLEYIDIPANAYLNLNSYGNSTLGLKLDFNVNPDGESTQLVGNLFGSIYYNGSTYYRYHISSAATGIFQVWFGTGNASYKDAGFYSNDNSRHYIELNMHSPRDKKLYVDNVDKGVYTAISSTNTGLVYLGARRFNNNGTVSTNNYNRKIRVYYCELGGAAYDTNPNDTSKMYPVQRKSDGKVGLLKIWNDGGAIRFCDSETSTDCIAGPTVQEYFEGTHWVN